MKPAPFKYVACSTVEEAVASLREYGDEAKVLAGGQSLVPLMNLRLARPSVLVDVNPVASLSGIQTNGSLTIGAMTRQLEVEDSPAVAVAAPLIVDALHHVGHVAIRSRGTFGGSLAHADPAAELPAVLLALDGEVVVAGADGERRIAAGDLFSGYFTTSLEPTEVLTEVRIPPAPQGAHSAFFELARRHGDFALVAATVLVARGGDGRITTARIVLSAVADHPVRAIEAEAALTDGATPGEAGRLAADKLTPPSDIHASASYRRKTAAVLVRRALEAALEGEAR